MWKSKVSPHDGNITVLFTSWTLTSLKTLNELPLPTTASVDSRRAPCTSLPFTPRPPLLTAGPATWAGAAPSRQAPRLRASPSARQNQPSGPPLLHSNRQEQERGQQAPFPSGPAADWPSGLAQSLCPSPVKGRWHLRDRPEAWVRQCPAQSYPSVYTLLQAA